MNHHLAETRKCYRRGKRIQVVVKHRPHCKPAAVPSPQTRANVTILQFQAHNEPLGFQSTFLPRCQLTRQGIFSSPTLVGFLLATRTRCTWGQMHGLNMKSGSTLVQWDARHMQRKKNPAAIHQFYLGGGQTSQILSTVSMHNTFYPQFLRCSEVLMFFYS